MRDVLVVGRRLLEPTGDRVGSRGGISAGYHFWGCVWGSGQVREQNPQGSKQGTPPEAPGPEGCPRVTPELNWMGP